MDISTLQSAQITHLAQAMLLVQGEIGPAIKDSQNPFHGSSYASLNSVLRTCRDALQRHGIWLLQAPMPAPPEYGQGHTALLTRLVHVETGEWMGALAVAPLTKSDAQALGSAISYLRRYSIVSILSLEAVDDDGNSASDVKQPPQRTERSFSRQAEQDEPPAWLTDGPDSYPETQSLPSGLPGVRYDVETDGDGRQIYVARGNTMPVKDSLKANGFRWNADRKIWWRAGTAA